MIDTIFFQVGERQGNQLFQTLEGQQILRPSISLSKALAFIFAAIIHSLTLIFIILGIFIIASGFPSLLLIIVGLIFLGIAWVLRPRRIQITGVTYDPSKLSNLRHLNREISSALNAPELSGLKVDSSFNASYWQSGIPTKHNIAIGLPLWSILSAQEKIALIAHEIAHSVNGDSMRGFFVGTAVHALSEYYSLLMPDQIWDSQAGIIGLIAVPINLIFLLVAKVVLLFIYLLSFLLYRDMQKAEYYADYLAAEVAGKEAMISLLKKLHAHDKIEGLVRKYALNNLEAGDLFDDIRSQLSQVAIVNSESIKDQNSCRLDATHPPTHFRIQMLERRSFGQSKLNIDKKTENLVDEELSQFETSIARHLIASYEASLYHN